MVVNSTVEGSILQLLHTLQLNIHHAAATDDDSEFYLGRERGITPLPQSPSPPALKIYIYFQQLNMVVPPPQIKFYSHPWDF